MAGAIPAWRLEWFEGEALVWTSAEARRQEAAVGLRHGDKEEPSAIEVCVCAVDTRDGREADQGQVPYRLECGVGWAAFGATRHDLPEPLHRAQERDEALVQQWLKKDYPEIKKMAQKQCADIYFGDAAHIRSDHHAGRTWGKRGETPIVEATGARHGMSLISAISSRGHMRFMIKQQGGVNAAVFIEFLKRLIAGAERTIFLIVDHGPAHIARKTRAFVESLNGSLRLFYLPPYSPDRNPDELVWKHLKADTVGRMAIASKDDFKAKVRSSMRKLQNNPEKISSFYQKPSLRYAA